MVSFHSYPWEGKGIIYFLKDCARNRPQMLLVLPMYLVILPACCYYNYAIKPKNLEPLARFRPRLIVYRDDDPKVRNIVKYNENGERIQLEPRKH